MRSRVGGAVAAAVLVVACGAPSGTPAPPTAAPTADPRHGELDAAEATWSAKRPGTLSYTTTQRFADGATTRVHVTEIDGRLETIVLASGPVPPSDGGRSLAVAGLFRAAREAIDGAGTASFTLDPLLGHVTRLEYRADDADSFVVELSDLRTPADRTAAGAAREALSTALERWRGQASPAWEYAWSRFAAADTEATASGYRVRHARGSTVLDGDGPDAGQPPPAEATIEGTVEAALAVIASGGWVDVAVGADGLDVLVAVDPSPSATGDGWWVRIDHTDRYAERARQDLAAARTRWTAAGLERLRYRWTWEGADGTWSWGVTVRGATIRARPADGAPDPDVAFVSPGVEALFDLLEQALAAGQPVDVTYDRDVGVPTRVEFLADGTVAPRGVITIGRLRLR
jgi:hypothetical protein